MIGDLSNSILEDALESTASEQLIVVLASPAIEAGHLRVEMRPNGSGRAYPAPCQAFVERDGRFLATEHAAASLLVRAGCEPCDLRWRIDLVSRQPIAALEKDSLGLPLALGAASLDLQVRGAPAVLGLSNYIDWSRIAASAGFDGAQPTTVCANNIAEKIEAAAAAGAKLFLTASGQAGIPTKPAVPIQAVDDIAATSEHVVDLQSATATTWVQRWETAALYLLMADTGLPQVLALLSFAIWSLTDRDWFLTVKPAAFLCVLFWYFQYVRPVPADGRLVLDADARRSVDDWVPLFLRSAVLLAANPGAVQVRSICSWYAGILAVVPVAGRVTLPETRLHVVRAHFTLDPLRHSVAIAWWIVLSVLTAVLILPTRTMVAEAMPPWGLQSIAGGSITTFGSGRFVAFTPVKPPPFAEFSAPAGINGGVIAVFADDRDHADRFVRFTCDQCSLSRDNKAWDRHQDVPLRNSTAEVNYFVAGNAQARLRVELLPHFGQALDTAYVRLQRE
jgi:hypothetical protein